MMNSLRLYQVEAVVRGVAQGKSNGGLFTWDGSDLDGKRVASGVYLVNTATQNGDSGTVTKIAIIR